MIGKSGLLSILQFVAVIIPAFVVLIEVVISRGMTEGIEIGSFKIDEIRLLEYSLVFLIFGTGLILYRLLSFIQNPFTTYGVLFIFGSIPLSVVALWIMSNRRDHDESQDGDISDFIRNEITNTLYKTLALSASAIVPVAAIWLSAGTTDQILNFGVFFSNSILSPHLFVSIGFIICAVRSMSSVNNSYENSEVEFSRLLGGALGSGIVIVFVYVAFVAIPYAVIVFLLRFASAYSFIEPSNILFNIPFVWSAIVYYALIMSDYTPTIGEHEDTSTADE